MGDKSKHTFSRSSASANELTALCRALVQGEFAKDTYELFFERASLRPHIRLSLNLKTVLSESGRRELERAEDTLSERERRALNQIDKSDLPLRLKEVAHGVLDIHERWKLMRSTARLFREARRAERNVLGAVSLDDVLLG